MWHAYGAYLSERGTCHQSQPAKALHPPLLRLRTWRRLCTFLLLSALVTMCVVLIELSRVFEGAADTATTRSTRSLGMRRARFNSARTPARASCLSLFPDFPTRAESCRLFASSRNVVCEVSTVNIEFLEQGVRRFGLNAQHVQVALGAGAHRSPAPNDVWQDDHVSAGTPWRIAQGGVLFPGAVQRHTMHPVIPRCVFDLTRFYFRLPAGAGKRLMPPVSLPVHIASSAPWLH